MNFYRLLIIVFTLFLVSSCAGVRHVAVAEGERIVVSTTYDKASGARGKRSDEFAYSFIPPEGVDWYDREMDPGLFQGYQSDRNWGYIYLIGDSPYFNKLKTEWFWLSAKSIESDIAYPDEWVLVPWFVNISPEIGTRTPYTLRENESEDGDWYRMGYGQTIFSDLMSKGAANIYCERMLYTPSGTAIWDESTGIITVASKNTAFVVKYDCPFRTESGLSVLFRIESGFYVRGEEIQADYGVIEDRLNELDDWLKPMWQSLVIRPDAYQFDPPEGAQQSIFCESHGYCW